MRAINLFNEIVNIMHHDYSGCVIKKGWDNPDYFKDKIKKLSENGEIDKNTFKQIVGDYLLDYKDDHVNFFIKNETKEPITNGFQVRRYEDKLYITGVSLETDLKKGMKIIALDGLNVRDTAEKCKRQLKGQPIERQIWDKILMKCTCCTVEDLNGEIFEFNLKKYKEWDKDAPKFKCTKIDEDILFLKINNFLHGNEFMDLINNNRQLLDDSKYIIIDVRDNPGGNNTIGFPLLEYLFNEGEVYKSNDSSLFNWTERNSSSLLKDMEKYLEKYENEDMIKFYNILKNLKVPGVYDISQYTDGSCEVINGRKGPEKAVILIDNYCCSSGESFVLDASNSSKVTLIGRNTHGELDYANVTGASIGDEFVLSYPVCYDPSVIDGKGIDNVGITPDMYIPWTPEHIERDVDIEEAIKYLKSLK